MTRFGVFALVLSFAAAHFASLDDPSASSDITDLQFGSNDFELGSQALSSASSAPFKIQWNGKCGGSMLGHAGGSVTIERVGNKVTMKGYLDLQSRTYGYTRKALPPGFKPTAPATCTKAVKVAGGPYYLSHNGKMMTKVGYKANVVITTVDSAMAGKYAKAPTSTMLVTAKGADHHLSGRFELECQWTTSDTTTSIPAAWQSCVNKCTTSFVSIGCYNRPWPATGGWTSIDSAGHTTATCQAKCAAKGYKYCATQWSYCFGRNSLAGAAKCTSADARRRYTVYEHKTQCVKTPKPLPKKPVASQQGHEYHAKAKKFYTDRAAYEKSRRDHFKDLYDFNVKMANAADALYKKHKALAAHWLANKTNHETKAGVYKKLYLKHASLMDKALLAAAHNTKAYEHWKLMGKNFAFYKFNQIMADYKIGDVAKHRAEEAKFKALYEQYKKKYEAEWAAHLKHAGHFSLGATADVDFEDLLDDMF